MAGLMGYRGSLYQAPSRWAMRCREAPSPEQLESPYLHPGFLHLVSGLKSQKCFTDHWAEYRPFPSAKQVSLCLAAWMYANPKWDLLLLLPSACCFIKTYIWVWFGRVRRQAALLAADSREHISRGMGMSFLQGAFKILLVWLFNAQSHLLFIHRGQEWDSMGKKSVKGTLGNIRISWAEV